MSPRDILADYIPVAERITNFYAKFPDGSLQSEIAELSDSRVVMRAYAYRTPDDVRPGVGYSSMPIPAKNTMLRDSEIETAETSAWGRAIASLGFDVKKGVASRNEIEAKAADGKPVVVEQRAEDGGLIGIVEIGKAAAKTDMELRPGPDGPVTGFRLRGDRGGIKVVAKGDIALDIAGAKDELVGKRVICFGKLVDESFTNKAGHDVSYQVLHVERMATPLGEFPTEQQQPTEIPEPEFDNDEFWEKVPEVGAPAA
jgi:hypothetical protein